MFFLNISLAIVWVVLTNEFTPANFAVGFILVYFLLGVTEPALRPGSHYFGRVRRTFSLLFFFLWEVIVASLRVAYRVLDPRLHIHPAVLAIPLDVKTDAEIALLANMITLTPGTLSLDVSDDRSVMYVHAMDVRDVDAFKREIKDGFERRILEAFH